MKRLLMALAWLSIWSCALSQAYNNEWIDFSKTYYKFKVGADGPCQISASVLEEAGLTGADASSFQLWRNGKQVPIYTSVSSGPIPAGGYIEFYGEMNDGKPDRAVFIHPWYQVSTKWSLFTDTAAYFLTVNPGGQNLRLNNTANNVASNTLAPERYYMCHDGNYYKASEGNGLFQYVDGVYIISSSYDICSFWIDGNGYYPGGPFGASFTGLPVYAAGPPSTIRVGFANLITTDSRVMQLSCNSQVIKDTTINQAQAAVITGTVSSSLLASGNATVNLANNNTTDPGDEFGINFSEVIFPSTFTFNNDSNVVFGMPPSDTGNYLRVSAFSYGSVAPVLYDRTNGLRITGNISTPGIVQWVLPPSTTARDLVLLSENPSNITQITSLKQHQFVNFASAANQGNYLLIAHPSLFNDGLGNNYVAQYQQYRNSTAGGGFTTKVVDVNELIDQFAYGIKFDPLSIKNFLRYARNTFAVKPQFALLIGHGVNYQGCRQNESTPSLYKLALVPTWGYPSSDMIMAMDSTQFGLGNATPLGRLSAISGSEVGIYLQKVKEYEQVENDYSGTVATDGWKKNVIHVDGADASTGDLIMADLNNYSNIISDTSFGGSVSTFQKTSTANVQDLSGQVIQNLFSTGVGFVNYFGHSAANILGYNLGDPSQYNMKGKYPFFIANGCQAGDIFEYDTSRFSAQGMTVTEDFIFASENGASGYIAATSYGIVNYLDIYNTHLYNGLSSVYYGAPAGVQMQHVTHDLGNSTFSQDYFGRCCLEQMVLNGDPFISLYHFAKPDYDVEAPDVLINPSIISVANTNFTVNARFHNLGRAANDSILVTIQWKHGNGTTTYLYNQKRVGPYFADSIQLTVPINPVTDKGSNTLIITLNADNKVSELLLSNNTISSQFYIYDQDVTLAYPYNYSIVNKSPVTFYASTADALDSVRNYIFEVDTTALFNSSTMTKVIGSYKAGLLSFNPPLALRDSVVYYWRVAILPSTGVPTNWSTFSFVYISGGSAGWNQSHYYQFQNDTYTSMELDSDRVFRYPQVSHTLEVNSQMYPYGGSDNNPTMLDGNIISSSDCANTFGTVAIFVLNANTAIPLTDTTLANGSGQYGSVGGCTALPYLFHFAVNTTAGRKAAINFINHIPAGRIIGIWNWMYNPADTTQFIGAWKSDTAVLGAGVSLYNTFKTMGFSSIDSFYQFVPILYLGQKQANGTWTAFSQQVGSNAAQLLTAKTSFKSRLSSGNIASTYIGPAKAWQDLNWKGSWDGVSDTVQLQVYGVMKDSSENLLYTSNAFIKDTSITFISAATYPRLHIKVATKDSVLQTPYQLQRLQVRYQEIPEGAISTNVFNCPDTLQTGQPLDFAVGFNNVSATAFDSLKVLMTITDNQNVTHIITLPRTKALVPGDSVHIMDTLASQGFIGKNTVYLDVNPNYDQPEQYLANNFLYKNFYVKSDNYQPTLDVTFDGVHILNQDIISAKPQILVTLTDNSPYLALKDSTVLTIQVRYPDGTLHNYVTGSDSAQFIPANLSSGKNIATVILHPSFVEDGNYQMTVNGQDESGNPAGRLSYVVNFQIINTPMITNVFNYPNPFTTSTAFVFTLTGTVVPQELRIEILTITGKIVREISEAELGPIHIGNNVTQYKWNGTDQYGNKVANGIYLYRVITNLNGKALGKFNDQGVNTNQYFKGGYGKMYLMR